MFDLDEYQPRIHKDKYKVQFTVDPDVMLTQPHRLRERTERWVSMEERMEGTNCALYQMGICSERDPLHKSLMSGKDHITAFYSLTKAANFDFRDVGSRFRFEKGELKDNSQIAELMILRAATESRHCMWKIISNAVKEGRHLSPAELQIVLDATELKNMPKGWEELGSRRGEANPAGSRDGEHARGEKRARTVGADLGVEDDDSDFAESDRRKRRCDASGDADRQYHQTSAINPTREGRGRPEIKNTKDKHCLAALDQLWIGMGRGDGVASSRQHHTSSTAGQSSTETETTKEQDHQRVVEVSHEDGGQIARATNGELRRNTNNNTCPVSKDQAGRAEIKTTGHEYRQGVTNVSHVKRGDEAGLDTGGKLHQHGSAANAPRNRGSSSPNHGPAGRQGQQAVVIDLTGDDSDDGGGAC